MIGDERRVIYEQLTQLTIRMILLQSLFGLLVILSIAYAMSEARGAIVFKTFVIGIVVHLTLTIVLLKVPFFQSFFLALNQVVLVLEQATQAGTSFVFGYLGGGTLPFEVIDPSSTFILAFKALPLILVISALSSLFYYYNILPMVVRGLSWLLEKAFRVSGAVGLGVAANAFIGMVEAPLLIKPYLKDMSRSEIFAVMVAGMSTIAGTMMVLYAHILSPMIPEAMGHILTASILNVFATLIIAMLMIPPSVDGSQQIIELPRLAHSSMDAIVKGTTDGVKLLINIIALLLVLVALVNLVNQLLQFLPAINQQPITLQRILGILMAPFTFLMGIPASEIFTTGSLMGTKIILNELIAYLDLVHLPEDALQERSRLIMMYAMCGFANIGSLGIMLGGMTAMSPEKREEIVSLGVKAVFAGVLATGFTATMVGLVLLL
jgi:CNT family concentrative nucleoside transporter